MSDLKKTIPVVCKSCSMVIEVEKPEPEKCRCGMTESSRAVKYVCVAVVGAFICLMGSCVADHYFTLRQIEAVKGNGYTVVPNPEKNPPQGKIGEPMGPEYRVKLKEEKKDAAPAPR